MEIKQVGVVGAGQMGHGIAQVFAASGYAVTLSDIDESLVQQGLAAIAGNLERLTVKGKLSEEARQRALVRIRGTTDLADFQGADLVIEAATESLDVKLSLFAELEGIVAPDTVLASNTSSIGITRIGGATKRPERVIGMHFMNPVPVMKLVEIVRGHLTADAVYQQVEDCARRLGKTPVCVNDSPGFVANRILLPMINEAIFALQEGLATAEDIDAVMQLGMNHPMGPLALADLIGLDTCLSILEVLYAGFCDGKYRPCPLLRKMVEAGTLGRKSGKGFYDYTNAG